ncbi:very short patch repair endonuclease [Promicromonospora sp. NFX87]|uniref:very short patch repair endonuclease n=1 Tax=Promicromonospora sp. NFX87 TaxID=3402691 RepID=UPI003AFA3315
MATQPDPIRPAHTFDIRHTGEERDAPDVASTRPSTTADVSARMSRQARKDTAPELALRRELHRRGLRYRVEYPVPDRPRRRMDIAFTRVKIAVFVDGCFWHACPVHGTSPRANGDWWAAKLSRNIARDRDTDARLAGLGWTVVRAWEHELAETVADLIEALVRPGPSVFNHAHAAGREHLASRPAR